MTLVHGSPAPPPDAVLAALRATRVVPVITIADAAAAVPLTEALVDGGLPVVEITLRTTAGLDALRAASAARVPTAIIGAGTVTTADAAEAAIAAGAAFVVSPGLVEEVVDTCRRHGVLALPGIATPTELLRAVALGCRTVKVFPASVLGGPAFIKAIAALGSGTRFIPTGGVTAESAPAYLAIPEVLAVGGSWMVPPERLRDGEWDAIRSLASACAGLRQPPGDRR